LPYFNINHFVFTIIHPDGNYPFDDAKRSSASFTHFALTEQS